MPNIHQEVLIGASAEKVYNAITREDGLSAWWTPETSAKAEMGSIARFPFGPTYHKEMKIIDLRPNEQVKWNCVAGDAEWIGTTLSFILREGDKRSLRNDRYELGGQLEQLQDVEKATLLIFHHDNWREDTDMFAECSYTWGQFLKSLKSFCETGKGRPYPTQHTSETTPKNILANFYERDLRKVIDEVNAFKNEEDLWKTAGSAKNSCGNLVSHLIGGMNHHIGATLGHTGYVRNRDLEFSVKGTPRKELVAQLEALILVIRKTLEPLTPEKMEAEFPFPFGGTNKSNGYVLMELLCHLNYHLGQINYLRRILE